MMGVFEGMASSGLFLTATIKSSTYSQPSIETFVGPNVFAVVLYATHSFCDVFVFFQNFYPNPGVT